MKPLIALVGRTNVGKSTLFNCLTRSRDAIVADIPGLTRDRRYGNGVVCNNGYRVVDTGGLNGDESGIDFLMAAQAQLAIEEADCIFYLVDGRAGLTPVDEEIAIMLRGMNKIVYLIVNKTDGIETNIACSEFQHLGLGQPFAIAASHGRGVTRLMEVVCEQQNFVVQKEVKSKGIKIAVVGRPNVGKSTLINRLLGEERVLTFDMPGTTRDSISIPFTQNGKRYTLIDTAGVRKRGKIKAVEEKFSVVKTLDAIEQSNVVILVVDAQMDIGDQDAHLLGMIIDSGRALLIAINKWDNIDDDQKKYVDYKLERKLAFVDFAKFLRISALHGTGVGHLLKWVDHAYNMSRKQYASKKLTQILEQAVFAHHPPQIGGRMIKLRYMHQGGQNPPLFIAHGNRTDKLPESYKRYLANFLRDKLNLFGTPIRISVRSSENPYAEKKNTLSDRQVNKKKRHQKYLKKKYKKK